MSGIEGIKLEPSWKDRVGDYLLRPQAWIFPFYLVDIPPVRVTVTAAP